jgi:putative transposase
MCEAIEGLALKKPPLPLTSVHRQAKQFAQLIGEPAPTYWVVRDIVLHLPNDLRTLAQQGTRRFGELYEIVHRREASRPNASICGWAIWPVGRRSIRRWRNGP